MSRHREGDWSLFGLIWKVGLIITIIAWLTGYKIGCNDGKVYFDKKPRSEFFENKR